MPEAKRPSPETWGFAPFLDGASAAGLAPWCFFLEGCCWAGMGRGSFTQSLGLFWGCKDLSYSNSAQNAPTQGEVLVLDSLGSPSQPRALVWMLVSCKICPNPRAAHPSPTAISAWGGSPNLCPFSPEETALQLNAALGYITCPCSPPALPGQGVKGPAPAAGAMQGCGMCLAGLPSSPCAASQPCGNGEPGAISSALKRQKEGQRQHTRDTPPLQLPSSSPALGCV